jgi:hypothetical protein
MLIIAKGPKNKEQDDNTHKSAKWEDTRNEKLRNPRQEAKNETTALDLDCSLSCDVKG